ncbi:hypothetical protein Tco_0520962 [Tanacetum coccineum]
MARQCTQPKRRRDAAWFKKKVLLVQAHAKGKELDEEQLAFLADPGVTDGQVAQTITHNAAFQTDDLDAYNSDCDYISSAKAVLMAISQVVIQMFFLRRDFDLAEESRLKMVEKQNYLIMKKEKINITPINYSELNKLSEDFGKRFVPQQELSIEVFWLQSSNKKSEETSTSNTPVKIEVPSELPKVILVNKSLKKLRFHLASFDNVVKVRTTPDAITEGSWGFEHTKKVFLTE